MRIGRSRLCRYQRSWYNYRFRFLALCWLACFSNTRFTAPFASRVATALIPVSLWLGSRVVGLKYWRIPVLILKKKQLLKNNGTYSATFTVVILHKAGTFIDPTSTCPLTTSTKSHPHKFAIFSFRCRQHSQNSQK